eukprot:TRINITY_DN3112_c0_g1_i2.p1 TRINITY_DN3112_c0_g1~~TRINITY_DN3112_c0_g1_i2.p1  ORF type:complete len:270 (-),score=72.56 TRINITY_DN3112_c0_g1_i2:118-825(-)
MGQLDRAIRNFTNAIQTKEAKEGRPEVLADLYTKRGEIHARNGSPESGLKDAEAALKLDPNQNHSRKVKAEAMFRLGSTKSGIRYLDEYLEYNAKQYPPESLSELEAAQQRELKQAVLLSRGQAYAQLFTVNNRDVLDLISIPEVKAKKPLRKLFPIPQEHLIWTALEKKYQEQLMDSKTLAKLKKEIQVARNHELTCVHTSYLEARRLSPSSKEEVDPRLFALLDVVVELNDQF